MREAVLSISDAEFAALGIDELVSYCRAAGLRGFEELACRGNGAVVQIAVERPLHEDQLQTLPYVGRCELVSETDETYRYVIAFTAPELSDGISEYANDLVGNCDPTVHERGATVSFVGSQEAIRGTIGEYEQSGISPDLRKLGAYDGSIQQPNDLTDRQREVIQTAYDMGYYEVPREVSTADIATEMDLDPSTIAEHLQRAERNLLTHYLSSTQ